MDTDRDDEIRDRYRQGASAPELARATGLSEARIRQIVKGVAKEVRNRAETPISEMHRRLGQAVYDHRFDRDLSRKVVAQRLGWSIHKLAHLEKGLVDPTLMDLQDLASYMKQNLGELLNNVVNRQTA